MGQRYLKLEKGDEVYIFRYEVGQEHILKGRLEDLAKQKSSGLDEFDAAVLAFQLGRLQTGRDNFM